MFFGGKVPSITDVKLPRGVVHHCFLPLYTHDHLFILPPGVFTLLLVVRPVHILTLLPAIPDHVAARTPLGVAIHLANLAHPQAASCLFFGISSGPLGSLLVWSCSVSLFYF